MKRFVSRQIAQLTALTFTAQRIGFWAGPLCFILVLWLLHPADMPPVAVAVMAVTIWMALWWITEAVPLPVTSLLPILLFPLLGVSKVSETTSAYGDPIVFLYIGGFLLAIAIEKTGLHKRIALSIIQSMGTKLSMIILGFMIATGFLSMWISNTATAIMMLPIGLAIVTAISIENETLNLQFRKALMLAIAYAASIGGLGTIIGTPPNLMFAGVVREMYQQDISFVQWFMVGFPVTVCLLIVSWWYLTRIGFPLGHARLSDASVYERKNLHTGKMSSAEKKVTVVFIVVALAWITRSFILEKLIPGIDDTIIAMAAGVVLFLLPDKNSKSKRLLHWDDASKLPWGIILLFGGGLALADGFQSSGLAQWIGQNLRGLSGLHGFVLILIVVALVNFLTEFTSNLATVTMILPVLAPLAVSLGVHPYILMVSATLAASCGFMMPAGTPPNAIAFGSGYLTIWDMVKNGFWLNIASIIIITCLVYFLLGPMWGIS